MDYAILLLFNETTEREINDLIMKIAQNNGNGYMVDNKIPPHISISLFQYNHEKDIIIDIIEENLLKFKSGNVIISSAGMFGSNVLFLMPTMNKYLLESNNKVTEIIMKEKTLLDNYYLENQWVPHVSLGVKLNEDELINGIKILLENNKVYDVKIDRLGLVECNPYKEIKIWRI